MKITRGSWFWFGLAAISIQILLFQVTFTSGRKQANDDAVRAGGDGGRIGNLAKAKPREECLLKRIAYRNDVYCSSVKIEDRVQCGRGGAALPEGITKEDCVQGLGCCFDDSVTTPEPTTPDQGGQVSQVQVVKCFHPNFKHAEVARLKYKTSSAAAQRSGE